MGPLAAAVLLLAGVGRAEPSVLGSWVERDPAADQRAVEAGIHRVAAAFPLLIRPLVSAYLGRVTRFCPAPGFALEGERLVFSCAGREVFGGAPDGVPFAWTSLKGDGPYTISMSLQGSGRLVIAFSDTMGGRTETWTALPDGTLTAELVYHSDKLPVPLSYALKFRREGG
ncbi:MAG: hypothetical protein ABIO70_02280 [Pseudomonadota bacterium]